MNVTDAPSGPIAASARRPGHLAPNECFITQPIDRCGIEILESAGLTLRFASSPSMAAVAAEIGDAVAVLTRDAGINAQAIAAAPKLRVIGNHGTGVNNVDIDAASRRGIVVVNTPGSNRQSVAEQATALMLAVARRIPAAHAATLQGHWAFRFGHPMHELHGKVLGIAGYGAIGRALARIARHGFGMRVIAWSPSHAANAGRETAAAGNAIPDDVEFVPTLDVLLQTADVVSLHRPARADTIHMIDSRALALMKPSAILINTSRGALIDEAALAKALRERHLFGAGLDVFEQEPFGQTSPLAHLPPDVNLVCAPHLGGSTVEALATTARMSASQIVAVLRGERPAHLVNPDVWRDPRGGSGEVPSPG